VRKGASMFSLLFARYQSTQGRQVANGCDSLGTLDRGRVARTYQGRSNLSVMSLWSLNPRPIKYRTIAVPFVTEVELVRQVHRAGRAAQVTKCPSEARAANKSMLALCVR
jgi:hypothetical protein